MKVRPILFNGEMVRALLDGRKTQTRRVVKNQPPGHFHYHGVSGADAEAYFSDRTEEENQAALAGKHTWRRCPYGVPGDRLWVRETWGVHHIHNHISPQNLPDMAADYFGISYRATDDGVSTWVSRWRPSIHMPRWASRITLEVTDVRVERVQAIVLDEIMAEGIPRQDGRTSECTHRLRFQRLWDSINAKRGYSWASNPWVWVVEFKVIDA